MEKALSLGAGGGGDDADKSSKVKTAFISTTNKAVHDIQENCLCTVMCMVNRLEGITEIVGQQMVAEQPFQAAWREIAGLTQVCSF